MTIAHVVYHQEPEGFWADSTDVDGFTVVADSLHELRGLVHEGLPFYLEDDDVQIVEEPVIGLPLACFGVPDMKLRMKVSSGPNGQLPRLRIAVGNEPLPTPV